MPAQKGVDNIVATVDANNCQIDGTTDQVLSLGNLEDKFRASGWEVLHIGDGNDIDQVVFGLEKAKAMTGKGRPIAVIMKTMMGNGVDFMMHTNKMARPGPQRPTTRRRPGAKPRNTRRLLTGKTFAKKK